MSYENKDRYRALRAAIDLAVTSAKEGMSIAECDAVTQGYARFYGLFDLTKVIEYKAALAEITAVQNQMQAHTAEACLKLKSLKGRVPAIMRSAKGLKLTAYFALWAAIGWFGILLITDNGRNDVEGKLIQLAYAFLGGLAIALIVYIFWNSGSAQDYRAEIKKLETAIELPKLQIAALEAKLPALDAACATSVADRERPLESLVDQYRHDVEFVNRELELAIVPKL